MKGSDKTESTDIRYWEYGWREHTMRQRRRLAAIPLSEKLQWLEEAHRIVLDMSRARSSSRKA